MIGSDEGAAVNSQRISNDGENMVGGSDYRNANHHHDLGDDDEVDEAENDDQVDD
jgi:hypothetical protein